MTNILRAELEHLRAVARMGCRATVEAVAAEYTEHGVWTEIFAWADKLRYLARRRPGSQANPYLVVADDFAELLGALRDGAG